MKYVSISRGEAERFSEAICSWERWHRAKEAMKQSLQLFALFLEFTSKVLFYIMLTSMQTKNPSLNG